LNNALTIREYQPADRDKVVEIVQAFLLQQMAPKTCVLMQWNARPLETEETDCGFKSGFLIGKKF
jgi:hypothetical protein